MADELILQSLDGSDASQRILDEFERRTGLTADTRGDGRHYALSGAGHHTRVVQTLTAIDPHWTDHIGLKMPS